MVVSPSDTVASAKAAIRDKEGIPLNDQTLFAGADELQDYLAFSDFYEQEVLLCSRTLGRRQATSRPLMIRA
eukprot:12914374-Alexandrium_andersonii.AAC.1